MIPFFFAFPVILGGGFFQKEADNTD